MRFAFIIFALLLCSSSVSAANLSFAQNTEYDEVARFSERNELKIILIPDGYDSVIRTYGNTNQTVFELGQYDRLNYESSSSSTVIEPDGSSRLLSNGQTLVLSKPGVYAGSRISDNQSWQVNVAPFIHPTVIWTARLPPGFEPKVQSGRFVLDAERTITVQYDLANFTVPGTYDLDFELEGVGLNLTKQVEVREVTEYSSSVDVTLTTVKAGDSGEHAVLKLSASGNKPANAITTITGNASSFLNVKQDVAVYPDLVLEYAIVYNVPVDARRGNYAGELVVNLDGVIQRHSLSLSIVDDTPPNVSIRIPPSLVEGVRTNASVLITDAENFTQYVDVGATRATLESQGAGFYRFFFTARNDVVIKACATDDSNNTACEQHTVVTTKDDWFTQNTAQRINTGRTRGEAVHYLGQREYEGTYLFSYDLVENTTPISIWLGDGQAQVPWYEGVVLNQSDRGISNLHVRMDENGEYTLIVRVDNPPDSDSDDEMRLNGRFRQYAIPQSFTLDLPGLVSPGECNPVEGVGFEDSFLACELRYRLDYDVSEISVPVTPAQLEQIEQKANATITEFEQREGVFFLIILLLAGGVLATLGVLWMAGQSRYIRRRG